MVNIIKEELPIEESLRKKLELICEFAKTAPTIINGTIRKLDNLKQELEKGLKSLNNKKDRIRKAYIDV